MTKKDYRLIARVIKSTASMYPEADKAIKALIVLFRSELYADNNRFDENKFEEACGIKEKYCEYCKVKPSMSMQEAEKWRCPHCGSK